MPKKKQEEPKVETSVPVTKAQKLAAVKKLGVELDKRFDTKTFQTRGADVYAPVPHTATGFPTIDHEVFGCGGTPRGRIVELYGPESAGKTAIAFACIAACQKAGGVAAFIDAEHAISIKFADKLGVNIEELVISQPDCGEEALDTAEALVESQAVDLIVIDSVAALTPRAEITGDMGDSHMGLQARLLSQACRKLGGICNKKGVTVIFINQIRDKIGLVFGNPETTTGGRALKFWSSIRVNVMRVAGSKGGVLKDGDTVIGHKLRLVNSKNKVAKPLKEGTLDLYYEDGFDYDDDVIEHALRIGVLDGAAWLTLKSDELGTKYRREDLPVDKLRSDITAHYAVIQAKQEQEYNAAQKAKKEVKSAKSSGEEVQG